MAGTASTPIANVAANDTVNGAAAILGAVGNATISQVGTWPAGIALNAATGAVTITALVPPGSFAVQYQLCDRNTPAHCANATDTVTVAASILVNPDSGTAVAGTPGTPIPDVVTNDTVNGATATLGAGGNATISASGAWPAGIALNTTTGAVTTTAALTPGTYNLPYQLCDRNTPPDCAVGTDTVRVTANILPSTESGTAVAGTPGTPIANVAANDTVNGAPATLGAAGNATVTQSGVWAAGIALNTATGAITTTAAVAPGTYSLPYQLCDRNTPANCAVADDIVTVNASIVATVDRGTGPAGAAGTPIANVAGNDLVNGAPAALGAAGNATVSQSGTWPPGVSLNAATGASRSPPPSAGYLCIPYDLCDRLTPPNCATGNDTLKVTANIQAVAEAGTAVAGTPGTPILNVAANDSVNGAAVSARRRRQRHHREQRDVAGRHRAQCRHGRGDDHGRRAARYATAWPISSATGTHRPIVRRRRPVTVTANIQPMADVGTATAGVAGTPVANVAANDSVNGAAAVLGVAGNATIATRGTWPAGIGLNTATGAVTTTAAVPPGVYTLAYQLCDKNSPPDCASATVTLTVTPRSP